jgi:hypothetical protein
MLAGLGFAVQALDHPRQELIASHTHEASHFIVAHREPCFRQGIDPGARVRFVAENERAIDVEQYILNHRLVLLYTFA